VRAFTRRRAERHTFPDHLPRERVVIDPPTTCACCGGNRLRKLGEDVTQTLETTPRRWKVIETVREKFSCRDCDTISQGPAPFPVIPRAWAGPSLLAMMVFEKFGQHQHLNRQAERYALEGAPIALSTMAADAVAAVSTALDPLRRLILPRDAQDLMAYPFFSLAKSKRLTPIDFKAGAIAIRATPEHGMATIWDADVLIWAASQIVHARDAGLRTSRLMASTTLEILTSDFDSVTAASLRLGKSDLPRTAAH
jgi:transposase